MRRKLLLVKPLRWLVPPLLIAAIGAFLYFRQPLLLQQQLDRSPTAPPAMVTSSSSSLHPVQLSSSSPLMQNTVMTQQPKSQQQQPKKQQPEQQLQLLHQKLQQQQQQLQQEWYKQLRSNQSRVISDLLDLRCPRALTLDDKTQTVEQLRAKWTDHLSDERVMERVEKCEMEKVLNPVTTPITSISFAISVHKGLGQLEQLLHLLLRPSHTVCIHVDAKASKSFHSSVASLVACYAKKHIYSNVFMVPDPIVVHWGHISLLKSDLKCLEYLMSYPNWRYFMNLASTSLPTFPMEEVEKRVKKTLRGGSSTCGEQIPEFYRYRIDFVHRLNNGRNSNNESYESELELTEVRKSAAPHNLTIFKSYREVVLNRSLAKLALEHPVAKDLLEWLGDTSCPDEYFFATLDTLSVNTTVQDLESNKCYLMPRYTRWKINPQYVCFGTTMRHLCQFSLRDLPLLAWDARDALFVNKFNATADALAAACWAERVS